MCSDCNKSPSRIYLYPLLFLCLLTGAFTGNTRASESAALNATTLNGGAQITLKWKTPVQADYQAEKRSLFLEFNQPIGDTPLDSLAKRLPQWIENVRYGYNSLLIIAREPADFTVATKENTVTIGIRPLLTKQDTENSAKPAPQEARLDYLRALALLESKEISKAIPILNRLIETDPNNTDYIVTLAHAEEQLGQWNKALKLYDRALLLAPGSRPIIEARTRLLKKHGNQFRMETIHREVKNADTQLITWVYGRWIPKAQWGVNVAAERIYLQVDEAQRIDGDWREFDGDRTSAEFSVDHTWRNSHKSEVALLFNPVNQGMRLTHYLVTPHSSTQFELAYQEPYNAYLESIIGHGVRSHLAMEYGREITPSLYGSAHISLNRFSLDDIGHTGDSILFNGELIYTLKPSNPTTTLSYMLETENVKNVMEKIDPWGDRYQPLPISDREFHSFGLFLENNFWSAFHYSLNTGYIISHLNSPAIYGRLDLTYAPTDTLEIGIGLGHSVSSARGSDDKVNEAGFYLVWLY